MRNSGKPKCLLVNDCEMQLMALSSIYSFLGYEVTKVLNGFKAIQEVKALSYEEITLNSIYSVIMMDLNMPVCNGFEACEKINDFFEAEREVRVVGSNGIATIDLKFLKPVIIACTSEDIS